MAIIPCPQSTEVGSHQYLDLACHMVFRNSKKFFCPQNRYSKKGAAAHELNIHCIHSPSRTVDGGQIESRFGMRDRLHYTRHSVRRNVLDK